MQFMMNKLPKINFYDGEFLTTRSNDFPEFSHSVIPSTCSRTMAASRSSAPSSSPPSPSPTLRDDDGVASPPVVSLKKETEGKIDEILELARDTNKTVKRAKMETKTLRTDDLKALIKVARDQVPDQGWTATEWVNHDSDEGRKIKADCDENNKKKGQAYRNLMQKGVRELLLTKLGNKYIPNDPVIHDKKKKPEMRIPLCLGVAVLPLQKLPASRHLIHCNYCKIMYHVGGLGDACPECYTHNRCVDMKPSGGWSAPCAPLTTLQGMNMQRCWGLSVFKRHEKVSTEVVMANQNAFIQERKMFAEEARKSVEAAKKILEAEQAGKKKASIKKKVKGKKKVVNKKRGVSKAKTGGKKKARLDQGSSQSATDENPEVAAIMETSG